MPDEDLDTYDNYYFKDRPEGKTLMSGYPLPKGDDGIVRNITFLNCDFHPNCRPKLFVQCTFTNCDGPHSYDY